MITLTREQAVLCLEALNSTYKIHPLGDRMYDLASEIERQLDLTPSPAAAQSQLSVTPPTTILPATGEDPNHPA